MAKENLRYSVISAKKEISLLFKTGNQWRCSFCKVIYKKNSLENDRFAILVSRQNGNAVQRNRIKRHVRELFRTNKRDSPPFFDFLIKAEPKNAPQPKEIKGAYLTWLSHLEKEHFL